MPKIGASTFHSSIILSYLVCMQKRDKQTLFPDLLNRYRYPVQYSSTTGANQIVCHSQITIFMIYLCRLSQNISIVLKSRNSRCHYFRNPGPPFGKSFWKFNIYCVAEGSIFSFRFETENINRMEVSRERQRVLFHRVNMR